MEQSHKEPYHEPMLIKHEPLLALTGQKYDEKDPSEKAKEFETPA